MNEHLQNEAKALGESGPGELPKEATIGFDGQCRVMKTQTNRYAAFEEIKREDGEKEGVWKEISNFTMDLLHTERRVDTEKKMVTYVMRINPATDLASPMEPLVTVVEPGELTPLANFEKLVLSRGRFQFWGKEIQYKRVRSMVLDVGIPEINAKDIAGYDPELGLWFAHNGIIAPDGKIYRADRDGVVKVGTDHYKLSPQDTSSIPRLPTLDFDYSGDLYLNLLFRWWDLIVDMYGPQTELGIGWIFGMCYGQEFYDLTRNHPLLMIHGPKGQGKTQLGYLLMNAFGVTAKPNPIQQLTITSLYTLVNGSCNIPQWLDEYKPHTFDKDIEEGLKNNYDRSVRTVGSLDTFKTKARLTRSTFLITGEYEPDDHAMKSRTVAVGIEPKHDDKKFAEAQKLSKSISAVTIDLLRRKNTDHIWERVRDRFEKLVKDFRTEFPSNVDTRILINYAKVCAVLDILRPDDHKARLERIKRWMVTKQEGTLEENPAVRMLMNLPAMMKNSRLWVCHKVNHKKKILAVHAKEMLFLVVQQDRDRSTAGQQMRTEAFIRLARDAKILIPGHADKPMQAEVLNRTAESGPIKTNQRCFLFDMEHPIVKEAAYSIEAHFGKDTTRADDPATE